MHHQRPRAHSLSHSTMTSQEEVEKVFDTLDSDPDGKITRKELRRGLQALKLPSADRHVEGVFARADVDRDRSLSKEEFVRFVTAQRVLLREVFDEVDTNGNGVLSPDEVEGTLKRLGMASDAQSVDAFMDLMDTDNDGMVDFDEWQHFLMLAPETSLDAVFAYWADAMSLRESDETIPPPPPGVTSLKDAYGYLAAGAISGVVSRTLTAPLDRLQHVYQASTTKPPNVFMGLKQLYDANGIRGLWRSNLANCIKVAPSKALKFYLYERLKEDIAARSPDGHLSTSGKFIAGGLAGGMQHIAFQPLDVVRTRLAVSSPGVYSGILDCFAKTARQEGLIRPFYKGMTPTLMSTVPHSGMSFALYEVFKTAWTALSGDEIGVAGLFVTSSTSGVAGTLISYPFHTVKTRMIMSGSSAAGPVAHTVYRNTADCFRQIVKAEGYRALYRGMIPSFMKSIPAHSISFVVYDLLKDAFNIKKPKKH